MKSALLKGVIALVCMFGFAHAATVELLNLKELSERSAVVLVGEVVEQSTYLIGPPHSVFTRTQFRVDERLKGEVPNLWTLEQLEGTVGTGDERLEQKVPGYARFIVGERVVLFLERTDTGRLVVTGLAQGKYRLKSIAGQTIAMRSLDGLEMVNTSRAADIHLAGVPRNGNRIPLNQLKEIVGGSAPTPTPLRIVRPGERPVFPIGVGDLGGQP